MKRKTSNHEPKIDKLYDYLEEIRTMQIYTEENLIRIY
jgi:hypothetical protein